MSSLLPTPLTLAQRVRVWRLRRTEQLWESLGWRFLRLTEPCSACGGTGKSATPGKVCWHCHEGQATVCWEWRWTAWGYRKIQTHREREKPPHSFVAC